MSVSIPDSLSAIDAHWLGQVLDAPVTSLTVLDSHAGTTGRALLGIDYAEPCQLPTRLFAKFPPADEMQRLFVTSSGMGRRESRFYEQLASDVPVRLPRAYYAASDAAGERYVMLLEDLGAAGCELVVREQSPAQIRAVLSAFARLHSRFWNSERFSSDLNWLEAPLQHDIATGLVAQSLEQYAEVMPPVFKAMGELYLEETDAVHAIWNQGDLTVVHGDVHSNNLFRDGTEPGFLDWALVARAPAMRDVGYYLAGTLAPEQLDMGEVLLAEYREQLLGEGVAAPGLNSLREQFAWHAAYVWVGAAVTLAMGDAWQPVSYVMKSLERLHPAMEHLGSVAALRAAL